MKKVVVSVITIVATTTLAVYASNAFFSDTETSSTNTFTAGSVDLQLKNTCSYNGDTCGEGAEWGYEEETGVIFSFNDIKPGDWGSNTISFKVVDNDAWMCANISAQEDENGVIEPEGADTEETGELGKYLQVFWWIDEDGDNAYDANEKILAGGPLPLATWLSGGPLDLTLADSVWNWKTGNDPTPAPIPGNQEQHLGIGWCFGTLTVSEGVAGFTCSGEGEHNDAQTDMIKDGIVSFIAMQHRNNPSFLCPENN